MKGNWLVGAKKLGEQETLRWDSLYLFNSVPSEYISYSKKKSNKKQTKTITLWKLPAVPSLSANIKSITDHRIQANIRKEMRRFSAFRTLLPSDGKEAISEIHAACVWKCTLPACILYSNNFCQAMWKERTERKIGKKLL